MCCTIRRKGSNMIVSDLTGLAVKVALEASAAQVASVWTIYSLCSATCSADAEDSEALAEAVSATAAKDAPPNIVGLTCALR